MIGDARNGRGGSWGDDDVILFAPTGGGTIFRVPAGGGDAKVVTRLDTERGENAHYWPFILPGSRKFLYFVRSVRPENNGIYIAAMDGSGATRLVSSLSSAIYAPPLDGLPGCLMWVQNDDLLAQPFDPDRAVLSGQPARIASGVRVIEAQRGLLASASRTGAVAWAPARGHRTVRWLESRWRGRDTVPIEEGDVQQRSSHRGCRRIYPAPTHGDLSLRLRGAHLSASNAECRLRRTARLVARRRRVVHTGNDAGLRTMMRVRLDGSMPPSN